ncbi:hypothetical protein ACX5BM_000546 [Listeria monocytogenes]|uniref:hypothetical protein n=1 Tax=Listeria monocytogenes TaxID=1639 RepID=UPI000F0E81EE|nr:hypothetical protein [Listeria monocytogenes]EAC8104202.1 hypothetical protein [Listeria monocytogenes]EAC9077260.1 hypothetical protein [Listeria monocytogenes]EBF5168837.1 hypothetical protein [Listeria monocytogenes]EGC0090600.1 hypothetical protein [Listeria monocytogenes]EGY1137252.1 hypothetical protein [Listeria monocytogenes]
MTEIKLDATQLLKNKQIFETEQTFDKAYTTMPVNQNDLDSIATVQKMQERLVKQLKRIETVATNTNKTITANCASIVELDKELLATI